MPIEGSVRKTLSVWTKEYKKGFFSYIVLMMLRDRSMYGLEIVTGLRNMTKGKVAFQPSGVYHILKKLNRDKLISSRWGESSKGPRRRVLRDRAGR